MYFLEFTRDDSDVHTSGSNCANVFRPIHISCLFLNLGRAAFAFAVLVSAGAGSCAIYILPFQMLKMTYLTPMKALGSNDSADFERKENIMLSCLVQTLAYTTRLLLSTPITKQVGKLLSSYFIRVASEKWLLYYVMYVLYFFCCSKM
jgi:hypothetical protein